MTDESMTRGLMKRRTFWIALLLAWSLGPMLWQLVSSFTTADALVNDELSFWSRWTLNNYRDLLSTDPPFWRYLFNSSFVASLTTLLTLMLAIPAAYGMAKLPDRWKGSLRAAVVGAALFPYVLLFLALLELARTCLLYTSDAADE